MTKVAESALHPIEGKGENLRKAGKPKETNGVLLPRAKCDECCRGNEATKIVLLIAEKLKEKECEEQNISGRQEESENVLKELSAFRTTAQKISKRRSHLSRLSLVNLKRPKQNFTVTGNKRISGA